MYQGKKIKCQNNNFKITNLKSLKQFGLKSGEQNYALLNFLALFFQHKNNHNSNLNFCGYIPQKFCECALYKPTLYCLVL